MNPRKVDRSRLEELTDLPNVGPACAEDLRRIGISEPKQLTGRDPYDLYETLCRITGKRHDPCVIDLFISITSFMAGGEPKSWWEFSGERRARKGERRPGG
jgi:hypothetical protein